MHRDQANLAFENENAIDKEEQYEIPVQPLNCLSTFALKMENMGSLWRQ
jgi:hypothetical protein